LGLIDNGGQFDAGREQLCRFLQSSVHLFTEFNNVVAFMHLYGQHQGVASVDPDLGGGVLILPLNMGHIPEANHLTGFGGANDLAGNFRFRLVIPLAEKSNFVVRCFYVSGGPDGILRLYNLRDFRKRNSVLI
jgi:hypothetical protein